MHELLMAAIAADRLREAEQARLARRTRIAARQPLASPARARIAHAFGRLRFALAEKSS